MTDTPAPSLGELVVEFDLPCSCDEAYRGRGMTDPSCHACEWHDWFQSLRTAIARLEAERDEMVNAALVASNMARDAMIEVVALQAENAALRERVEKLLAKEGTLPPLEWDDPAPKGGDRE